MSDDRGLTRDEARRRAVEAAKTTWIDTAGDVDGWDEAIAAYERAMADAGWRMARDVGPKPPGNTAGQALMNAGWDACRAAMLGDE